MKTLIRILIFVIIIIIGFFGIRFLLKDKEMKSIIIESKIVGNNDEGNYTYLIYSDGTVVNTEEIKNKEIKELSQDVIDSLIELIDKVDKNNYTIIQTDVAVTSGNIVTIYDSKKEKIVIKDFYLTNLCEEAERIIEILKENELY